jgi:hypothetical protein
MTFQAPPSRAAWRHQGARDGFEVAFLGPNGGGVAVEGHTSAVEGGEAWVVRYGIVLDAGWSARRALVENRSSLGSGELAIESGGTGRWRVDGKPVPHLDGCLDVDLEASALTNAFPVHRLGLGIGDQADAPAVYVRALDLGVERLEQRYLRLPDDGGRQRYHYSAPRFDFECELVYDESGLVLDYPGIAIRAA